MVLRSHNATLCKKAAIATATASPFIQMYTSKK